MTEAPARGSLRRAATPLALLGLLLVYTAFLHRGAGPPLGLEPVPWWASTGFFVPTLKGTPLEPLVTERALGGGAFLLPALGLACAVFLTTRSVVMRTAALAALLANALFLFYGLGSPAQAVWRLFHWRGSAVMMAVAGVVSAAALSPTLAARWLERGWAQRLVLYGPVFLLVVALERNVTGTNPELPFAVSPWPAVTVFGLELAALGLAALFAGIALGLVGLTLVGRAARVRDRALAVALVLGGLALPSVLLAVGSATSLLPIRVGQPGLIGATCLCAAGLALAARVGRADRTVGQRSRTLAAGALLAGIPVLAGALWVLADYEVTRTTRAQRVIDALAAYYEREEIYPDALEALRTAGDLEAVPRPGFGLLAAGRFDYESFGTSYLLEFSAPRWVQCAYSPPFEDEDDAEVTEEDPELREGAWSCPQRPPELW